MDSIEKYLITSENLDASTINQHVQAQGINWSENASDFYKRLMFNIKSFDEQLDPTYEVGIRLVNFGEYSIRSSGNWLLQPQTNHLFGSVGGLLQGTINPTCQSN